MSFIEWVGIANPDQRGERFISLISGIDTFPFFLYLIGIGKIKSGKPYSAV